MTEYINGTIGTDRVLTFESKKVYTGERNRSILKIPVTLWADDDVDFYMLHFETQAVNGSYSTNMIEDANSQPAYISDGYVYCPIMGMMTSTGSLKVQLSVHTVSGNVEIIEKTSVAKLTFEPSVSAGELSTLESKSVYGEIGRIDKLICGIKTALKDYNYFCAAAAACLLYENAQTTRINMPETAEEAEELITSLYDDYEPDSSATEIIVVPGTSTIKASLALIYTHGGSAVIGRYSCSGLLELLRNGVDADE